MEYAEVIIVAGANVSETFPTLTHWIWKARDRGAKIIVVDPRMIPLARTADIHLDVRPGTDSALYGAMLKYLVDNDMLDDDFIDNYTSGFQETIDAVKDYTLEWAEEVTESTKIKYAKQRNYGAKPRRVSCFTPVESNTILKEWIMLWVVSTWYWQLEEFGKPYCGYGTITGQGGREHGHKCDQLPGNRDIENPEHRKYISEVWEYDEKDMPGKGLSAYEIIEAIHRGEIKGLISICFNPLVLYRTAITFAKHWKNWNITYVSTFS